MNDKQKDFLENMCLKTIESMFQEKNINVLSMIKEANKKELFFSEFYDIMFVKMITQFPLDKVFKIILNYEEFGLDSGKASNIFNDSIKHLEVRQIFTNSSAATLVKMLNQQNLFLNSENINKIKDNIDYTKRDDIIENNDKIKSYFNLNEKLPPKGITSSTRKI